MADYTISNITGPVTFDVTYIQGVEAGSFESTGELSGAINQSIPAGSFESTGSIAGTDEFLDLSNTITLFKFILTGAEDSTTDLEMSISSFQLRMYATTAAYLNVVIPGIDYAAQIAARSNGNLELWMCYVKANDLTDVIYSERVLVTQFDNAQDAQGAVNQSITLSGNESTAQKNARAAAAKTITLDNGWLNYIGTSSGLTTARLSRPHITLKAGDTVVLESGTIVVGLLTWMKSESNQLMQITEQSA